MADETQKRLSDLLTAERTSASDLFETAIPNSAMESGYASRKVSASEVANLFNKTIQYGDLLTEDKTIVGAISEIKSKLDDVLPIEGAEF